MKTTTKIPFLIFICLCILSYSCNGDMEDASIAILGWNQDVIIRNNTDKTITVTDIDKDYEKVSLPKNINAGKELNVRVKCYSFKQHWKLSIIYDNKSYTHTVDHSFEDYDCIICIDADENGSIHFTENEG